jgi:hypothetical protein
MALPNWKSDILNRPSNLWLGASGIIHTPSIMGKEDCMTAPMKYLGLFINAYKH